MRVLLLGIIVTVCGCRRDTSCLESVASGESPTESTVPFFDAHGHRQPTWGDSLIISNVIEQGELTGMAVLGPATAEGDNVISCAFVDIDAPDLAELQVKLEAGARCIGELSIRHFPSGPDQTEDTHSATSSFLMSVYELAREHSVPVIVHFDYSTEFISEFESALSQTRTDSGSTMFVWAHMGDAQSADVRQMLRDHDNLYVDISSRNPLCTYSGRLLSLSDQRLDDGNLVLKEGWRLLFEDYSDRVLFGTDIGPGSRHTDIVNVMRYARTILGQLSLDAQNRIAHENAEKLFGLDEL